MLKDGFMKLKMYVCKREDPHRGIDIFFKFFTVKLFKILLAFKQDEEKCVLGHPY